MGKYCEKPSAIKNAESHQCWMADNWLLTWSIWNRFSQSWLMFIW